MGSNDVALRFSQGNPQLSVVGPPGAVIAFDGRGRRRAVADQTLVLSPDACKAGESKSTLTINQSGQVRVTKEPAHEPPQPGPPAFVAGASA